MSKAHSTSRSSGAAKGKKSGAELSKGAVQLKGFPIPTPIPGPLPIGQGNPQPLQAIQQAGQFSIATTDGHFVTAVAGGGKTTDVLHTDAVTPKAWEEFALWFVPLTGEYGIQTLNGEFLFATNGGDLSSLFPFGDQEVDTIQSTAENIIDYERFKISNLPSKLSGSYATYLYGIQTVRGFYLSVAGGNGTDPPVLYTNGTASTASNPGQQFMLLKSGDAGSGYTYGLMVAGGGSEGWGVPTGSWLIATLGGGQSGDQVPAVTIGDEVPGNEYELSWTLIRQSDGSYAFQTASSDYLTANGGGALGFSTDGTQVGNWQKFTLTPNNDCTYYVQSYNGNYIGYANGQPNTTSDVTQAIKWRLWLIALAPTT
jgi:hypothetical protein